MLFLAVPGEKNFIHKRQPVPIVIYGVRKLKERWQEEIRPYLPPELRWLTETGLAGVEEIRLRAGKPVIILGSHGEWVADKGTVTAAQLHQVLLLMTEHSLYARDEELKRGYLALPGGHRAGFAGRAVLENGRVKMLRDISGVNIRVAREVRGAGEALLPHVYCSREKKVRHTLIVSPPQAGKTTVLRDLCRLLSDGDPGQGRPGFKVGIVDERSEIAGCYAGCPQLDVGMRSDVLDGCPKAEGMMMLVRALSPQVVATDELGRPEDVAAVEEVINSGASVLATAHGGSLEELVKRPALAALVRGRYFERLVFLSRRNGPGTVEGVISADDAAGIARSRGGRKLDW